YPQIGASGNYSRVNASGITTSCAFSNNAGSFCNQYTSSLALSQNIYDFGKTYSQVKIQRLNLDSANSDLETSKVQIVLNVKQAYYGGLQAARNRAVAEESVRQYQQHLEQAK